MTDEAASDDTAARLALEIPADVASEITRDAAKLLRDMFVADRAVETDQLGAMCAAASIALRFVTEAASRLLGLRGFPAEMPGAALKRLVAALIDRNDGNGEPSLSPRRNDGEAARRGAPTLPLNARLDRVEHAVALDLLMAKGPQSAEDAAKELLDLLRDSLAAALVRQWRPLHAGGDSTAAESFKERVDLAKREVDARGMDADAYIAVIRTMLIPKN